MQDKHHLRTKTTTLAARSLRHREFSPDQQGPNRRVPNSPPRALEVLLALSHTPTRALAPLRRDSVRQHPVSASHQPSASPRPPQASHSHRRTSSSRTKNGRGSAGDADHKPQTPTDRPKTLKTTGLQTLHAAEAGPEARGADRPTLMVGEAAVRVVLVLVVLETVGLVAVGSRERSLCHLA